MLSSVHPVFGLYGSFFPVIVYAIFGMGRHVATGKCLFAKNIFRNKELETELFIFFGVRSMEGKLSKAKEK